ncbi:MAG: LPXTG cell wall anchor domain-containing protein [Clostridia bacterium]|nr:LPXTG cell wall anchor domain-containing protein [Clostridia bacterium]
MTFGLFRSPISLMLIGLAVLLILTLIFKKKKK